MKHALLVLITLCSFSYATATCTDPCSNGSIAPNEHTWKYGTGPGSEHYYMYATDGKEHPLYHYYTCGG